MNNFLKYSLVLFFGITTMYSQTTTNQHKAPSATSPVILDMSTIDESIVQVEKAKGFVLPVVEIDNLLDTIKPIQNPAEGLMVYNQGKYRIAGVYMFKNGMWSAIVNRGSSIENAVAKVLNKVWRQDQTSDISLQVKSFEFNNTYGDVEIENEKFKLLPGNYLISIYFSGNINYDVQKSLGEINQPYRAHLINLEGYVLVNGKEGLSRSFVDILVPIGKTEDAGKNVKKEFTGTFYFAVVVKDNHSVVEMFLKTKEGTTYDGEINIVETYVNVEKSVL